MLEKLPIISETITTEMVMPNDTNPLGNLMGGILLKWMDVVGAVAAYKHADAICVTASADSISFKHPIKLGDIVTLKSSVTRAFNSSMEVFIEVYTKNLDLKAPVKCNEAYFTFVSLDKAGKKQAVPKLIPQTEEEQYRYERALRRRELRLVLAGKLAPENAPDLKAIFDGKK